MPSPYLDPAALAKLDRLDLRAARIVEGFMSGLHKSPFHGFSVEFAQYRGYVPGDDVKHIDWRVFAKSGRYTVKQFEEETNLTLHIVLDASQSMAYGSAKATGRLSKLEYAKFLTASLGYLALKQSDAAALVVVDQEVREHLAPSTKEIHLQRICAVLESLSPDRPTDLGGVLMDLAGRIRRRGIVVLISDLFDDPDRLSRAVARFRHGGHEVVVFHLLDEVELTFPFDGLVRFQGLEGGEEALCQPRMIRALYLEEVERYLVKIKTACRRHDADYVRITTTTPMDVALRAYLGRRLRVGKGRAGR